MLLNSHLESTKDHATERKSQLKIALQQMEKAPDSVNVIFGGDLNLRDKEVIKNHLKICIFNLWNQFLKIETSLNTVIDIFERNCRKLPYALIKICYHRGHISKLRLVTCWDSFAHCFNFFFSLSSVTGLLTWGMGGGIQNVLCTLKGVVY